MIETWYIMEDGSCGNPNEIKPDKDGKLTHKDGRKVAYGPHGPRSRSVDPEAEKAKKLAGEVKSGKKSPNEARAESGKPPIDPPKSPEEVKVEMEKNPPKPQEEVKAEIEANPPKSRDMKPEEPKRTYKTR